MKSRVLYLCGQSPWPCNGGALIRNAFLIRALSRRYIVDLVTAQEPAAPMPDAFRELIGEYACFPRANRLRSRAFEAAIPSQSTLTAGWTGPELREFVADRLGRHPYAAIQVDLPMFGALPRRDAIPIVYNAHNCEYELLSRRARVEPPHVGLPLALDALRVRRIESALVARSTLVIVCAQSDLHDFERFCPSIGEKAALVPNGVDVVRYAPLHERTPEPHTVLVSGSMDWRPNVLGLRWFLREVLPKLRQAAPGVRVRVAGRMQPSLVSELRAYPEIDAFPNPASMEEHLAAASVVAAPIVASSGTRLRILEAWAASRPVVTTTAGAFGLRYEDDREMFVRDNPLRFAYAISRLLADPAEASGMVERARERVVEYDWEAIGEELLAAYDRSILPPRRVVQSVKEEVAFARP